MSLFAEYIRERCNKEIIETEKGFLTYFFIPAGVYIEDLYIKPDFRHSHEASKMADKVAEIAKARGVTKMYGTVMPSANNSTDSMKVLIAYGFKIDSAEHNAIVMVKEI